MVAAAESKIYHFDEACKHNNAKDCWLIIDGKVYDVTPFLDEHPGGDEVLIAATGKDATKGFEEVGHRYSARGMMGQYLVGEVDASTVPASRSYVPHLSKLTIRRTDKTSSFRFQDLTVPRSAPDPGVGIRC